MELERKKISLDIEDESLSERIKWATTVPNKPVKTADKTIGKQKEEAKQKEMEWGNSMIGQTNNGQWSTKLGENLVYDVLKLRGENPVEVKIKGGGNVGYLSKVGERLFFRLTYPSQGELVQIVCYGS